MAKTEKYAKELAEIREKMAVMLEHYDLTHGNDHAFVEAAHATVSRVLYQYAFGQGRSVGWSEEKAQAKSAAK